MQRALEHSVNALFKHEEIIAGFIKKYIYTAELLVIFCGFAARLWRFVNHDRHLNAVN